MKKILIIVAVIVAAVVGIMFLMMSKTQAPVTNSPTSERVNPVPQPPEPTPPSVESSQTSVPMQATITFTDDGPSPANVTIKAGGTVTFKNNASDDIWPASNPHPAHTAYPESGGCRASAFDACKGIPPGSSYTFTFKLHGNWSYHDHLNAVHGGTITVQ